MIFVLGDKSRFSFLREILKESDKDNENFKKNILGKKDIKIVSDNFLADKAENCLVAETLPFNTSLFFPATNETSDLDVSFRDRIILFDEFPFRTAEEIENIKNLKDKNITVVLYDIQRQNLVSDVTNMRDALEDALKKYQKENINVEIRQYGESFDFLFSKCFMPTDFSPNIRKKIASKKSELDFLFNVEYEVEYVNSVKSEIEDSPVVLDSIVKFEKHMKGNLSKVYYSKAKNYFIDKNFGKYFSFVFKLYKNEMNDFCDIIDKSHEASLKKKIISEFESTIKIKEKLYFSGAGEKEYIFFLNENNEAIIKFKNQIKIFFSKKLYLLVKDFMIAQLTKMEEILNG